MTEASRLYTVHAAQKREGEKDFLTRIGSAWSFKTKDGRDGLNIQLSALPVGDRVVIFENREDEPAEPEQNGKGAKYKR